MAIEQAASFKSHGHIENTLATVMVRGCQEQRPTHAGLTNNNNISNIY